MGLNRVQTDPCLMNTVSLGVGFEVMNTFDHPFWSPENRLGQHF